MEHCTSDAFGTPAAAWFLAAAQGNDSDLTEPDDAAPGVPPNVIIAVSLDELDGLLV